MTKRRSTKPAISEDIINAKYLADGRFRLHLASCALAVAAHAYVEESEAIERLPAGFDTDSRQITAVRALERGALVYAEALADFRREAPSPIAAHEPRGRFVQARAGEQIAAARKAGGGS